MAAAPDTKLTLRLKAKHTARAVDALCGLYGYQPEVADPATGGKVPNPQPRLDFAEARIEAFVRDCVKAWEAQQAGETARKAAADKADRDLAD